MAEKCIISRFVARIGFVLFAVVIPSISYSAVVWKPIKIEESVVGSYAYPHVIYCASIGAGYAVNGLRDSLTAAYEAQPDNIRNAEHFITETVDMWIASLEKRKEISIADNMLSEAGLEAILTAANNTIAGLNDYKQVILAGC